MNFHQIFSAGFNSGLYGGKNISAILSGTYINFDLALKYIEKENLLQDFKQRIEKLLVDNENSGYCMFHDMPKLFDNYFGIGGNNN